MKRFLTLIVCFSSFVISNAWAEDGLSVGAALGYASIEDNDLGFSFDAQDTGYKIFAKYTFAEYLGIEGAYVDFGNPSDEFAGLNGTIDAEGYTLFGVGALPLGNTVEIFGKAGVISWDADSVVNGLLIGTDDGTDLALGLGANWNAEGTIGVRAEFEWFDIPDADNVWMASLGLTVRF